MISDIIISVVLIIMSIVWAWIGIFDLGLWIPGVSADSGFIPTIFAVVTLICCTVSLVQSMKKLKESKNAPKEETPVRGETPAEPTDLKGKVLAFVIKYAPAFFGIFGILCLQYLGLIPMVALVMLGWMKLMNKFSWPKSIAISACVTVVIYLIFDVWLQIPFPGLI